MTGGDAKTVSLSGERQQHACNAAGCAHALLRSARVPVPAPGADEMLIRITVCGICRTDLHIADDELPLHKTSLIMGHEVVGMVMRPGPQVQRFSIGDRVGVPWLGGNCHHCDFCDTGLESLCDDACFTGWLLPLVAYPL